MLFLKLTVVVCWLHLQYAFCGLATETYILNLGKFIYLKIRERVLSRFWFYFYPCVLFIASTQDCFLHSLLFVDSLLNIMDKGNTLYSSVSLYSFSISHRLQFIIASTLIFIYLDVFKT